MREGFAEIAIQQGEKGYYAKVRLEIVPDQNPFLVIELNPEKARRFQTAARFGVEYAWEQVPDSILWDTGGKVIIKEIHQHLSTTNIAVAYVAALATWNALDFFPKNQPTFDEEKGLFLFPYDQYSG